jgi:hypothetical protein
MKEKEVERKEWERGEGGGGVGEGVRCVQGVQGHGRVAEPEQGRGNILRAETERDLELRAGLVDGNLHSYEKMAAAMGVTAMGAMKLFKRTLKKVIDRSTEFV